MRILFFASVAWLFAFVLMPSGMDTCQQTQSFDACHQLIHR